MFGWFTETQEQREERLADDWQRDSRARLVAADKGFKNLITQLRLEGKNGCTYEYTVAKYGIRWHITVVREDLNSRDMEEGDL